MFTWNARKKSADATKNVAPTPKKSLDVMMKLAEELGNPHEDYRIVHVAGTNGKGSVCLKTAAGLQEAGLKVGLFTSPHICCFRERIRVNSEMISEDEVVKLYEVVITVLEA